MIDLGPRPPLVELSFYFAHQPSGVSLKDIVGSACEYGASLGSAWHRASIEDLDSVAEPSHADLRMGAPNTDDVGGQIQGNPVVRVRLRGLFDYTGDVESEVGILSIPEALIGTDRHPVSVACDGIVFDSSSNNAEGRRRAAAEIISCFKFLVQHTRPSYSAILFEWPLLTPCQFVEEPDGFQLDYVYVDRNYLGDRRTDKILELADEAGQIFADGVLVIASENLSGRMPNTFTREVASAIAANCGRH